MKRSMSKHHARRVRNSHQEKTPVTEDFSWLGEIYNVLSPYWSARSGYQGAWARESGLSSGARVSRLPSF